MLPARSPILIALIAVLIGSLAGWPAGALQPDSDTLSLVEEGTQPSNIEIAVRIADETFVASDTVLITRDDRFADALSSGLLQVDAPLLMVPTAGPVPSTVTSKIDELSATRAIILGGVAAVSTTVEAELRDMGLTVERREGGSRFETAIDVASTDAPAATTVMLARAFPSPGGPESQGFADTLAAGGISAREGYPILLTETAVLTSATADYLDASQIERVLVMGGTAAISDAVTAELSNMGVDVERVAGDTRDETAVEIAKISGDDSAADATRVIITEGEGENAWARGFALASHAAAFDAPIVLALADRIPESTAEFLGEGIGGDQTETVLTCAVSSSLCEETRQAALLPPEGTEPFTDVGPVDITLSDDDIERIEFEGLSGERIGIGYQKFLAQDPEEVVCLEMVLFGPDNQRVAGLDHSSIHCTDRANAASGSTVTIALPRGGSYTLQVSFRTAATASLEAFVTSATETGTEIDNPPSSIEIDRPGQIHRQTFTGEAGGQIGLGYRNFLPGVVGQTSCAVILLRSPADNDVIGRFDHSSINCTDREPTAGSSDVIILPFDGLYVIETAMRNGTTGSLDLFVTSAQSVELSLGTAEPVTLTRPGALHRATLEGTEGQDITLSYANLVSAEAAGSVCLEMSLISPNGDAIAVLNHSSIDCSDRDGTNVTDQRTLPVTGSYVLETSFRHGRSGSVSVRIQ